MEKLSMRSLQHCANNKGAVIEYFRDVPESKKLLENCCEEDFISLICTKYHYPDSERKPLSSVACKMKETMLREAVFSYSIADESAFKGNAAVTVVITLGAGVDCLQENYTEDEMLSECYMAENIAGEVLLQSYAICNRRISKLFGMHVSRYLFMGAVPEHGMEEIPLLLEKSGLGVRCNFVYCMVPKKSVVFYALLSEDEGTVCEGICVGCKSSNCPNRMKEEESRFGSTADLTGVAFNYGYARIFGRKYT